MYVIEIHLKIEFYCQYAQVIQNYSVTILTVSTFAHAMLWMSVSPEPIVAREIGLHYLFHYSYYLTPATPNSYMIHRFVHYVLFLVAFYMAD